MICDTDEIKDYIGTYCDTIQKEFPRIKREVFKNNSNAECRLSIGIRTLNIRKSNTKRLLGPGH